MRLSLPTFAALLPVAGLLSGCAMGTGGTGSVAPVSAMKSISGTAHGGQQPVTNGVIAVYTYGTSGYGSTGTLLASTTSDSTGYFNVNFSCPSATAPVYVLSIGGNPAPNLTNNAILLGAAIGPCDTAATAFVTINEISTTGLAFALSHFFSSTNPDGTTSDHFGGPSSSTQAISLANNDLMETLLDVENGYPRKSTATFTNESAKIITIGDILGACVNSSGPGSPSCSQLFANTTPPGGTAPVNTLEAAVNMALYPAQNVANLYALQPPSGSSAFPNGLATQPNDWTLAVSYTAPTLGLGVNTRTDSTLDIDAIGRVWFPSNLPGAAGVAYFDPASASFSPLYTVPGLVRPEQVAIDIDGYVWESDLGSSVVAGFPATNPTSPVALSLPGTTSSAVTIFYDNTVRVGTIDNGTAEPALGQITGKNSYTPVPNTTIPGSNNFVGASLAGDPVGGVGIAGGYLPTPTTYDTYYSSQNNNITPVVYQPSQDAGQVVFTGNGFVNARGGYNNQGDGICIYNQQNCFSMANQSATRHPTGTAIDGAGSLWLADNFTADIQQIPLVAGSYLNGSNLAMNQVYTHDKNNGNTMQQPSGIGVDRTGNVWVSNYSCLGNNCTPGPFVLSEVIGAAAPTITPISLQVVIDNLAGTEPALKTPASGPAR